MSTLLDWAGVLGGPVGVALGYAGSKWFSRKVDQAVAQKNEADAAQAIAVAATTLVEPLQRQISELDRKYGDATQQLGLSLQHIRALYEFIATHIPHRRPPAPPADLRL